MYAPIQPAKQPSAAAAPEFESANHPAAADMQLAGHPMINVDTFSLYNYKEGIVICGPTTRRQKGSSFFLLQLLFCSLFIFSQQMIPRNSNGNTHNFQILLLLVAILIYVHVEQLFSTGTSSRRTTTQIDDARVILNNNNNNK